MTMRAVLFCTAFMLTPFLSLYGQEEFTPLFDGETLDGWEKKGGAATYIVEEGKIIGCSAPNTPNTFLCTKQRFRDFVFTYEFKCDQQLNSGVQFRSECYDQETSVNRGGDKQTFAAGRVHGYQVEIDPNKSGRMWTGGIYDEGRRGWLFPGALGGDEDAFTEQGKRLYRQGQWNSVRVECRGDHIQTWLNGKLRADFHDSCAREGFIALQVHEVGNRQEPLKVRWRNLMIRELD